MGSAAKYRALGWGYHWEPGWIRGSYGQWVRRVLSYLPADGSLATEREPDAAYNVLDAGCGDGYPASLLVARGYRVLGVDELEEVLRVARRNVPGAIFQKAWPYTAMDFVLALESIEHMEEPGPLVEAVRRCRRYAIVTCPPPEMDAHAVRGYGPDEIRALFERCEVEHLVDEGEHQLYRIKPFVAKTAARHGASASVRKPGAA